MARVQQVAPEATVETSIRAAVAAVRGAWAGKEAWEVRQDKQVWVVLGVRAGNSELISLILRIARANETRRQ